MINSGSKNNHTLKIKDMFFWFLVLIVIMVAVIIRVYMLKHHFTHEDDIAVAYYLRTIPKESSLLDHIKAAFDFEWTYAPLQIWLEDPLVHFTNKYEVLLVVGRIWSFIFGAINCFLIYAVSINITDNKRLSMVAAVVTALSWENIIYSSQMEPYEIAVTFLLAQCLLISLFKRENFSIDIKLGVISVVVCTMSCYAHYQLFVVTAIFFGTLGVFIVFKNNEHKYRDFIALCGMASVVFLLCIPLIYSIINKAMNSNNLMSQGVNWNAGIERQFLYYPEGTIINKALYTLYFFAKNTVIICKSFIINSNSDSFIYLLFTMIFILVCLFGLLKMLIELHAEGLFLMLVLVSFYLLVLMRRYPYGPSRHTLILFPVFVCLFMSGIKEVLDHFEKKELWTSLIIVLIFSSFIICVNTEINQRKNFLVEEILYDKIQEYDADIIYEYGHSCDFVIMEMESYENLFPGFYFFIKENMVDAKYAIFYSRSRCFDEEYMPRFLEMCEKYDVKIKNWKLVEKIEIDTGTEIEYASKYYENYKNGFHMYVYEL